MALFKLDSHLG